MTQCATYITYQLPMAHTRFTWLLDAIQCSDPGLQAAMAFIRNDDGIGGKRSNFETTASYLLPYDPVTKKRKGQKRGVENISDTTVEVSATSGGKEYKNTSQSFERKNRCRVPFLQTQQIRQTKFRPKGRTSRALSKKRKHEERKIFFNRDKDGNRGGC